MNVPLKFNAGKVEYDETTLGCTPLQQKGTITIKSSLEDADFSALAWTPRDGSAALEEDELLLIPGDVRFRKVELCDSGRVFSLYFLLLRAKHFFWLQSKGNLDDPLEWTLADNQLFSEMRNAVDESADIYGDEDDPVSSEKRDKSDDDPAGNGSASTSTSAPSSKSKPTSLDTQDIASPNNQQNTNLDGRSPTTQ